MLDLKKTTFKYFTKSAITQLLDDFESSFEDVLALC
jgi:hypothetical protein